MLQLSNKVAIPDSEIEIRAVQSQGSGGQHVNKVATAVQLFFDVRASSLPDAYKDRILSSGDHRLTKEGVVVIKAQEHRTQEANREEAARRLAELIRAAMRVRKKRKPTRPSRRAKERRLQSKNQRSRLKSMRGRVRRDDG